MDFLEVLGFITDILNLGSKKDSRSEPKIFGLFKFLFVVGFVCLMLEINAISHLPNLWLFVVGSLILGLILSIGTILLLFRFELIDFIRTKDYFTISIPILFITPALVSFLIRIFFNSEVPTLE